MSKKVTTPIGLFAAGATLIQLLLQHYAREKFIATRKERDANLNAPTLVSGACRSTSTPGECRDHTQTATLSRDPIHAAAGGGAPIGSGAPSARSSAFCVGRARGGSTSEEISTAAQQLL